MAIYAEGAPDNEALREIRDILKESKKHNRIMIVLTIIITILTLTIIIKA